MESPRAEDYSIGSLESRMAMQMNPRFIAVQWSEFGEGIALRFVYVGEPSKKI
jgi:hypothetical protein